MMTFEFCFFLSVLILFFAVIFSFIRKLPEAVLWSG